MPYNPSETYQGGQLLARGAADAGKSLADGIARFAENKQKMDNLELSAAMIAKSHPDVIDPETLEKFSKGGLGQREALVGQMTAAVLNKYRTQTQGMEQQRIDLTAGNMNEHNAIARRAQELEEQKAATDTEAMIPRTVTDRQGTEYLYTPGSRATPRPLTQKAIPAPGGKTEDVIMGADDKPAYRLRWNPTKGEYDHFDIRPRAAGAWDIPPIDPNAPKVTTNGNANPPAQPVNVKTKAERDALPAGTRYIGPDGRIWTRK